MPTVRDTPKSRPFAFVEMETLAGDAAAIRHLDGTMESGEINASALPSARLILAASGP